MKTPLNLVKKLVFIPLANLKDNFFKKVNISKIFNKTADIIFEYSKETALIMLVGDAISILSSHNQQINGLKKSDRENKELLIQQEKIERGLDLVLSIVPPFLLTRGIKKKLESMKITTKDVEQKLYKQIAPGVGAHAHEIGNIEYIRPVKETIYGAILKICNTTLKNEKTSPNMQNFLKKVAKTCKQKVKNLDFEYERPNLEKVTSYFDDMGDRVSTTIRSKLRNGSAYDEVQGMVNGLCIAGVIAYSIFTSNIVMPIVKNKVSNFLVKKELEKKGETKESIKRKKRFAYTTLPVSEESTNIFSNFNSDSLTKTRTPYTETKVKIPEIQEKNTFASFNQYSQIASQSTGLRI